MHHVVFGTDTAPHGLSTTQPTNDKGPTTLLQRESCDHVEPKFMVNLNDFVSRTCKTTSSLRSVKRRRIGLVEDESGAETTVTVRKH